MKTPSEEIYGKSTRET